MSTQEGEASDGNATGEGKEGNGEKRNATATFTKTPQPRSVQFGVWGGAIDNREAAREKICETVDLVAAPQDGGRMTGLSKVCVRGCLRTRRVLELLNQGKYALGTYANGIKKSKPYNWKLQAFKLSKMFKEAQGGIALRGAWDTRCDPLRCLPTELVESILQYLSFPNLVIAQRVSKGWRSFIRASHKTYTSIDFSATNRIVPVSSFRAYVGRSGGNVRELRLPIIGDYSPHITPDVLSKAARIAPNLTILITNVAFYMDSVCGILQACRSLHTFECEGIVWSPPVKAFTSNLRRLKIGSSALDSYSFPEELLHALVKCLPDLEDVQMAGKTPESRVDLRSLKSLSALALTSLQNVAFPLLPESVRVLQICQVSRVQLQWPMEDIAASPLPDLESFSANYNRAIDSEHLLAILEPSLRKRSLRLLSLRCCNNIEFGSLEWLVEHGENLENLDLGGNAYITDNVLGSVAKFKKLKFLGLSFTGVSGAELAKLVRGSAGVLEEVDVWGCRRMDFDETQLVAETGVKFHGGRPPRDLCG